MQQVARWVALVAIALAIGCTEQQAPRQEAGKLTSSPIVALPKTHGLHNVLRIGQRIYSGSEPHGDEGFAALEKLGVKTIVSVDGAKPNLDRAHAHGMRYVHIPIGYASVPTVAGAQLARVAGECEGPIYVHCHHGQHRGPAAAAVLCQAAGELTSQESLALLEKAGTGKNYTGLWRDVAAYQRPANLANAPPLVETAQVESFAATMAGVDRHYDHLKFCEQAGWSTPAEHPDLAPVQETVILKEAFRELRRTQSAGRDARFIGWLTEAEGQADALETALRSNELDQAAQQFKLLDAACKRCHTAYRNTQ
jgi:protein tyrosine phosphatase (PTP) superfamily phosphohydrolase (DUF442 family)